VNTRRLYRCRHDRQLAGVASGMAEYLDLDPTVVRILWILSAFFGGFTILLYIILAFVMPLEPLPAAGPASGPTAASSAPTGEPSVGAEAGEAGVGGEGFAADPATTAWIAPGTWTAPAAHEHRARGEGRLGFGVGVLLVIFGAIALIGPAFPGWVAGMALGPAFVLALGVALVIVATRRGAVES
jgi:phage shock protein C